MGIDSWSTGTLRGRIVDLDGNLVAGSLKVEIIASTPYLTNAALDAMIPTGIYKPACVTLATGNGNDTSVQSFQVTVPATDDTDVRETGWAVRATLTLTGITKPVVWTLTEVRTGQVIDLALALPDQVAAQAITSRAIVLDNVVQVDSSGQLVDGKGNVVSTAGSSAAANFAVAGSGPSIQGV